MSRRLARIAALETLYLLDSRPEEVFLTHDIVMACRESLERHRIHQPDSTAFALQLVQGTWEHRETLDQVIAEKSVGWSLHRIGRLERAIMRMALYEMREMAMPQSVAINEAVELSKEYVSERAAAFVNGILGALVREENPAPKEACSADACAEPRDVNS